MSQWIWRAKPVGPGVRRAYDMAYLQNQQVHWTSAIGPFPWKAAVSGQTWEIGLTAEKPIYRLMIEGTEAGRFQEWPAGWDSTVHLTPEQEWLRRHRAEHCGEWVFLDGDRLVAHGRDFRTVHAQARAAGLETPFVEFIEEESLPSCGF
ncbi:MAG: DUF5678 domain-containing protein [Bryobacteraceae bacterium]